jgi:hypothetical protein
LRAAFTGVHGEENSEEMLAFIPVQITFDRKTEA